jgi:actin-related protein
MSLFYNLKAPIILECNSSTVIAGFAGENQPKVVFPCVIGRNKGDVGSHYSFYGDEVFKHIREIEVAHPIADGLVTNFDHVEMLYRHVFSDALEVASEEHPVLLIEPPLNPIAIRERTTRLLFETFQVPAFALVDNVELALYATGRQTGLVVFSEYHLTWIVPVHKGEKLKHAALVLPIGRRDVINHLAELMNASSYSLDNDVVADICQKHAYLVPDYTGADNNTGAAVDYETPDAQLLFLRDELFGAPEILFQPNLAGKEDDGLHRLIFEAVNRCDAQLRGELYANIVLAGDNTLYPGMAERLKNEVATIASVNTVQVIASENRAQLAFLGGQMLAGTPAFEQMCITAGEYSEFYDSILSQKFPS